MPRPHITVGVSGGIAAYKAVELVRALQQANLDPHVILTRAAENFIAPLTFSAITGHRTFTSLWNSDSDSAGTSPTPDAPDAPIEHIALAQATRALVIAPATAHTLARLAHGLADDFLTTVYLATTAPVILAPAMNVNMLHHPATRANLRILAARGHSIVAPGSGFLACGMTGDGRLADTPAILAAVLQGLKHSNDLAAETILVTAGGTREAVDPVRFLGNRSSGRMGYALAAAAVARGARVILISAPTALPPPVGAEVIHVTSAEQMLEAVLEHLPRATAVLKTAAVADFRPASPSPAKLKRGTSKVGGSGPSAALTLALEPTPDILREVVARRAPATLVLAFAAETDSPLEHGRQKLRDKGVDAIFINDVSNPAIGFDSDSNAGLLLSTRSLDPITLPFQPKSEIAQRLLDHLLELRAARPLPPPAD